nr:PREDICTED: growth/differentiation factor 9 [Lepisosteus oculatus]
MGIGLALCLFSCLVLSGVLGVYVPRSSQTTASGSDDEPKGSFDYHGSILSSLLKALSEKDDWIDPTPRQRPDSKYVSYMKRLYRMSAKHGPRGHKSHLYNTVRLFTPRDECLKRGKELFTGDLSYNLDRLRAQELLLKSVLLYWFDKENVSQLTSICHLDIKEQELPDQQVCSSDQGSFSFPVQIERRNRRKWIEVDVTSFLQTLIKFHRKSIHLVANLTCIGEGGGRAPLELSLKSPSLLLYLNDTSELAHQRRSGSVNAAKPETPRQSLDAGIFETQSRLQVGKRSLRTRRNLVPGEAGLPDPTATTVSLFRHFQKYDFPTDECELHDFRVSFSQLKLDHWIIAPHRYNPRYCKGVCPGAVGYHYGSPVHTVVQNIIYEKLDSSVPKPSCVPSEYSPLSVLTIENDGSIAYKEYEEMIATKCTCR